MRWRQVIVLWIVLAVLGAEYWLVERPRPAEVEMPSRRRFVTLDADAIREVRVRRGDRTVVARRDGARWVVVAPPEAALPPDLIAAFVDALTTTEEIAEVATDAGTDGQFGLGEGASRVEIVPADGEPLVLTLGGTNPPGTAIYARRDPAPDVVLIGRNVRYYEELIFEALPVPEVPATDRHVPVGG